MLASVRVGFFGPVVAGQGRLVPA